MNSTVQVPDYYVLTSRVCPRCGGKLLKGYVQWLCRQCGWMTLKDPAHSEESVNT